MGKRVLFFINGLMLSIFTTYAFADNHKQNTEINHNSFVILQYHHVSTATPNSTSVSPETFKNHMAYLSKNFTVIDLADAIDKLKNKQALPNKSVAITFDDGFKNILENGHPVLQEYNFPYTIFVNPALIGESSHQLTWEEARQMKPLATFANHTLDHAHLLNKGFNESPSTWLRRVMEDVNLAEEILLEELGYSKKWLAYPFGEFNLTLKKELLAQGYIGFGQQSGAMSIQSDFGALPRFPAAGVYANLDSLQTKLNSLAMPVTSVLPDNNEYSPGDSIETLQLVIESADVRLSAIACYFKGETLPIERDGSSVLVSVNHEVSPGRARINCTAPSNAHQGRFYWYSYPIFTPTETGDFLD